MTKNGRRGLFLLVATLANMLLTFIIIIALIVLWSLISQKLGITANTMAPAIIVAFLAAVILSGLIYSKVLKALQKRPDLEERFGLLKK
jgi:uncharacterized protein YqfA (UPF0365 family)